MEADPRYSEIEQVLVRTRKQPAAQAAPTQPRHQAAPLGRLQLNTGGHRRGLCAACRASGTRSGGDA
jgi:hypothetical protein